MRFVDPAYPIGRANNTYRCAFELCSAPCLIPDCGNGQREAGEECDPPNGSACGENCRRP